jgi:hypothetical protein
LFDGEQTKNNFPGRFHPFSSTLWYEIKSKLFEEKEATEKLRGECWWTIFSLKGFSHLLWEKGSIDCAVIFILALSKQISAANLFLYLFFHQVVLAFCEFYNASLPIALFCWDENGKRATKEVKTMQRNDCLNYERCSLNFLQNNFSFVSSVKSKSLRKQSWLFIYEAFPRNELPNERKL